MRAIDMGGVGEVKEYELLFVDLRVHTEAHKPYNTNNCASTSPAGLAEGIISSLTFPEEPMNYAVILAGGAGTRLWPLSRERLPKTALRFYSDQSLSLIHI